MKQLLGQPPTCIQEPGSLCHQVYSVTHNEWVAASAGWLITKPLKIVLILLVALAVRYLARRLIDRLTTMPNGGKLPTLLKPLREKAPDVLGPMVQERRRQRAKTIGSVLKSVASFAIYGLAFVLVLGELGIDLGPIIASAGIVGVALGFGAQNLVKDFLSGMFMMLEDQYGVGDIIDVGPASGTVEAVGLRITTLRDMSGTVWYVRNGEVLRVGNSSQGFAVAVVDVPVAYGADVARAGEVLDEAARTVLQGDDLAPFVLEPHEVLGVESVTPESIKIRLTVKVRPGKQYRVQRALRGRLVAALEGAGIEPPLSRLRADAATDEQG